MTETQIEEGWKKARIQQCLHLMRMHDITIEDLQDTPYNADMVNIAGTQTPHLPSG